MCECSHSNQAGRAFEEMWLAESRQFSVQESQHRPATEMPYSGHGKILKPVAGKARAGEYL
jgi:hypothetical protein